MSAFLLVFFPLGFGCRGTERRRASEPQRSGAAAKAVVGSRSISAPDSEVVAKPKRRTFTAEYKQRILMEPRLLPPYQVALVLCPPRSLYSSLLAYWRRERAMEFARL